MEYHAGKESHKSQASSPSLLVAGIQGKKYRALPQAASHRLLIGLMKKMMIKMLGDKSTKR